MRKVENLIYDHGLYMLILYIQIWDVGGNQKRVNIKEMHDKYLCMFRFDFLKC